MKKFHSSLMNTTISLFFILLVSSCYAAPDGSEKPTIYKTFKRSSPGSIEIKTSGGGITVAGYDGNEVQLKAYVKIKGRLLSPNDPELEEIYSGYDIFIDQQDDHTVAIAKKLNDAWKKGISVAFYVRVPNQTTCDLNTSGGSINVSNVNGIQKINTSGGIIELKNIEGNTTARTSGGGIFLDNLYGDTHITTSGGRIEILNTQGMVKASTSGGAIKLHDISGSVDVSTSGGSIDISGRINSAKATTSGGSIHVNITELTENLHLSTSGGSIHAAMPSNLGLNLDLAGNKVNAELQNFNGYNNKKGKLQGTINNGGIPVYMHTSGGSVNIEFN